MDVHSVATDSAEEKTMNFCRCETSVVHAGHLLPPTGILDGDNECPRECPKEPVKDHFETTVRHEYTVMVEAKASDGGEALHSFATIDFEGKNTNSLESKGKPIHTDARVIRRGFRCKETFHPEKAAEYPKGNENT